MHARISCFADRQGVLLPLLSPPAFCSRHHNNLTSFLLSFSLPSLLSADYVADLCVYEEKHCLLSVAGDGTLAVIDLRKHKVP